MAHKVHPKAFRIKEITDWYSRWFGKKNLPQNLEEDFRIRKFLRKKLKGIGVEKIEIERFPTKVNVLIWTSRPGIVIGRRGEGIERLRNELKGKILNKRRKKGSLELRLEIKEIRNPWSSANLTAQWMAQRIKKRIPYRRVLKQALSKIITNKEIKGAKVQVSGRLNGVMIARTEWLKKGELPRQTIRADIDYGTAKAFCTYGVIGIKVWIYKGEKF